MHINSHCKLSIAPASQLRKGRVERGQGEGVRTVRLAHQITMAGDKVLSGDCRFAHRNYFPVARKEIVARVTMARNPSPTVPRHGDAQRVSLWHSSPVVVVVIVTTAATIVTTAASFFTSLPLPVVRSVSILHRHSYRPCYTPTVVPSPPLPCPFRSGAILASSSSRLSASEF